MEGPRVADANLTVYIYPSKVNKCRQALLRQLSSLLFTYSEVFDGVILAFEVHIRSRRSKLLPEREVMKLGKESIHVFVLGFSSVSIMFGDICEELKFNIKDGEGVFSSTSHKRRD